MWLVIAGVLGIGVAILALVGLLAVARELLHASSLEPNDTDDGAATGRQDIGPACGRRHAMTP